MGKNGNKSFDQRPQAINITYYSIQLSYTPSELISLLRQWIQLVRTGVQKRDIFGDGLTDEQYTTRWNISKIVYHPALKYSFAIAQMRGVMAMPPDMIEMGVLHIVCYRDITALVDACKIVLAMLEKTEIEAAFPVKLSKGAQRRFKGKLSAARMHSRNLISPKGRQSQVSMSSGRGR